MINIRLAIDTLDIKALTNIIDKYEGLLVEKTAESIGSDTAYRNLGDTIKLNHYKVLVNQKVNYSNVADFVVVTEDEPLLNLVEEFYDKKERNKKNVLSKDIILHGDAFNLVYIDDNGDLSTKLLKGANCIPIYANDDVLDILVHFGTYYDPKVDKDFNEITIYTLEGIVVLRKADDDEYHLTLNNELLYSTPDNTLYYPTDDNGRYYIDSDYYRRYFLYNAYYFSSFNATTVELGDEQIEVIENEPLAKLPIVHYKFNEEAIPLYRHIKDLLNMLNANIQDYKLNLDSLQEVITVFKGFQGNVIDDTTGLPMTEDARLTSMMAAMKNIKAVGLPAPTIGSGTSNADVDFKTTELPHSGRDSFYEHILKAIYEIGAGISKEDLVDQGAVSGVAIQKLFSLLDLDVNEMIDNVEVAVADEVAVVAMLNSILNKSTIDIDNIKYSIQINKSAILNTTEIIDNAIKLLPLIDKVKVIEMLNSRGITDIDIDTIEDLDNTLNMINDDEPIDEPDDPEGSDDE